MFIEWIIDALIELPPLIFGGPGRKLCPKCGNRLRFVEGSKGTRVQCVMCDQVWQFEKGQTLRPINAQDK